MRLKRVRDSLFFISASVNHSQKETTCISQRSHPQMKRRRVLASLFLIPFHITHSQSQHKNNHGMTHHQTGRIATQPSLFLTLIRGGLLLSVNEAKWNTLLTTPFLPFQSPPRRDCSRSHTPRTHRSKYEPPSTLSASHNPSV